MKTFPLPKYVAWMGMFATVMYLSFATVTTLAQDSNEGVEVMTRGPIHEAFAEPVNSGSVEPLVVPKQPPDPIEEIPPDVKPDDDNTIWISGYWTWDDDRKDFTWVSGVWRIPPPGQYWVEGYWTQVPDGYSWVPGFWAPAEQREVEYFPQPPETLEQGPTSDPPTPDSVWISGCWRWVDSRYVWQPGHWAEARPDNVWVPASYYWSPRGWIFCDGYWDYALDRRGVLFAPVYFSEAVYRRPGYHYSPSVVLDTGLLTFNFFVRPRYNHYYFGDYYAADYDGLGIYPWFGVHRHHGYAYDPLFTYYRWHNHDRDPNWVSTLEHWHGYYRDHPDHRPPRDFASVQRVLAEAGSRPDRDFLKFADTLDERRQQHNAVLPLSTISEDQKAKYRETAKLMGQWKTERRQLETREAAGRTAERGEKPAVMNPQLKKPEKMDLPQVARTLQEQTPRRLDGKVRETLKPVTPPAEQRKTDRQREDRRPEVPPQPPERDRRSRDTRENQPPGGPADNQPTQRMDRGERERRQDATPREQPRQEPRDAERKNVERDRGPAKQQEQPTPPPQRTERRERDAQTPAQDRPPQRSRDADTRQRDTESRRPPEGRQEQPPRQSDRDARRDSGPPQRDSDRSERGRGQRDR